MILTSHLVPEGKGSSTHGNTTFFKGRRSSTKSTSDNSCNSLHAPRYMQMIDTDLILENGRLNNLSMSATNGH